MGKAAPEPHRTPPSFSTTLWMRHETVLECKDACCRHEELSEICWGEPIHGSDPTRTSFI
eukprot:868400-Pelagomonas_calceolata.AAC.6